MSDNDTPSPGARFTIRSANSPTYTFTRRSGIRKKETSEAAKEQEKCGTRVGTNNSTNDGNKRVKDQTEEGDTSVCQLTSKLHQNGTAADETNQENSADVGMNSVFERLGRSNLPSRSQSFDWRSGTGSPVRSRTMLPSQRKTDFRLEESRTKTGINITRKGTSLHLKTSPANHSDLALDKANKVKSLPSRFRSEFGHGSGFTETFFGPKGGQSIQERIQKLYESVGESTTGGTFPRRFSTGGNSSPVHTKVSFIWTQRSETVVSPETIKSKETSPSKQWQGSFNSKNLEGVNWSKDMMEIGTKSLDRARSRNSIAAQIRSARTAGEIFGTAQPENTSEDRNEPIKVQEKIKEKAEGTTKQTEPRSVTADKDMFDTNPQKNDLKTAEGKKLPDTLSVHSSASVRNKINQFEALTQNTTHGIQLPRWPFYAPTQPKCHDGVKKSRSAKEIRERGVKWEMTKEGGEEEKAREKSKKFVSKRSLSVDEVGLRLEKMETEGKHLADKDKNYLSEDFDKYSRLKKTMHLPLDEGTQRHSKMFYLQSNFPKDSSPKDSSKKETSNSEPSLHSVPLQPQQETPSPVSDDDETPTNIPDSLFFAFPAAPTEKHPFVADNKNKNTSVIVQEDETDSPPLPATFSHKNLSDVCRRREERTDETDFPPLLPATDSESNMSDVFYPNDETAYPKGKKQLLDLNAWVAGLNPAYEGWNEFIGSYEDDDESTQKDDDSNYDSDSGDSSVTITSNKSQSDRRSFSLSLAELCNFSGAEYESDEDVDEWEQHNRRSASLSSDLSAFSCVSLMPAEELDKLLEDVKDLGDETLREYDDIQVVVLHKEFGVGLGFSLAGGADQNKPITVHKVFPSGVAAKEGSIREGDQVLSINGTALSGTAHWEALQVLRRAKTRDMVVVVLRKGDVTGASQKRVHKNKERAAQSQQETGQRVCVQLQKNSRDLGFSLQGGVGSSEGNRPLTVQKVFQGGPVEKVFPGDEVVEIQHVNMLGMRRLEVWTFIRKLPPGPVEVVLHRPHKPQRP
ncbi:uncharacterized protein si:dkey-92i15.4 [Austrofundulus limnaeus]|uniref:Uncharacterized protein LOC106518417 n=1 Tax=Austrofundulus limnaeus TaxID=52670 RepID=A0A2I4BBL9_AUSLI|nr:PREDICTED: uncharacterized protein LOC106518417 [Austrofundulus limnaeus]XP_013865156.1 PREDICTED: uncharacterized protein LOC106518417 [Austrofundulus limnaeus]